MAKTSRSVVALFGEAEKGQFKKPYLLREMPELVDLLGNPPPESEGIFFAIQSILYRRDLIYFRVKEEGLSLDDYFFGLQYLQDKEKVKKLHALCMPGVGEPKLIDASQQVCEIQKSVLLMTEKDLYDYLTT
jgi:hypothetical protein